MTHLETISAHPRKNHRVYRSPASLNDPSPYSKTKEKQEDEEFMEMDPEDKEASAILMALAQHANRIIHDNASKTASMSIRNLLDGEAARRNSSSSLPFQSLSNESKPFYESRRNSNLKKGFKISLQQRHPPTAIDENQEEQEKAVRSFEHMPVKFKRNATHILISYRIHAHQSSLLSRKYETNSYPSAFHSISHYQRDWTPHQ